MAKILSLATHGTDDPTKCTLAFVTAVGAVGAGKEVTIGLVGEGVVVAKEAIAKTIHGVGFPPLPELIEKLLKAKVPIFV
jgi:predicted peroxiredoxin